MKILFCLAVFGFSIFAAARPVGDQEADVIACTSKWLETTKGIPADQVSRYFNDPMTNVGGPELPLYVHFVSGCLSAKGYHIGDTSKVGNPQTALPLSVLMPQFDVIIR